MSDLWLLSVFPMKTIGDFREGWFLKESWKTWGRQRPRKPCFTKSFNGSDKMIFRQNHPIKISQLGCLQTCQYCIISKNKLYSNSLLVVFVSCKSLSHKTRTQDIEPVSWVISLHWNGFFISEWMSSGPIDRVPEMHGSDKRIVLVGLRSAKGNNHVFKFFPCNKIINF